MLPPRNNHQIKQTRKILPDQYAIPERRGRRVLAAVRNGQTRLRGPAIKPIERLVPVSFMRCRTSTPGLSTWWSPTALKRDLVLRGASRLDAFSSYPVRT